MSKEPTLLSAYVVGYVCGLVVMAAVWLCWDMHIATPLRNEFPPYQRSRAIRAVEPRVMFRYEGSGVEPASLRGNEII